MKTNIYKIGANEDFFGSLTNGTINKFYQNCNNKNVIILLPTQQSCYALEKVFSQLGQPKPEIHQLGNLSNLLKLEHKYVVLNRFDLVAKVTKILLLMNVNNFNNLLTVTPLSEYIANFIHKVELYQLDLNSILSVIDGDLALHQQDLFDVFKQFIIIWKQENYITKAGFNNLLIDKFSKNFAHKRVIIAGVATGIPVIKKLLQAVALYQHGSIVLYGVDDNMMENEWLEVEAMNGQFNFKELFKLLKIDPGSIDYWCKDRKEKSPSFLSNALKPSISTINWHKLAPENVNNLKYLKCNDQHHEAKVIVNLLENKVYNKALVVVPDDKLMVKIISWLGLKNIDANIIRDYPLKQSKGAIWMSLCLDLLVQKCSIFSFLSLLKNPLVKIDKEIIEYIETLVRDRSFYGNSIFDLKLEDENFQNILAEIENFKDSFSIFNQSFAQLLSAHIAFASNIAKQPLWQEREGEELEKFLQILQNNSENLGFILAKDYPRILQHFLNSAYYRLENTDYSITIAKPIDARLHSADLVILSGLNENIWPETQVIDPFFNRSLQAKLGLPLLEQTIGEEAHNFFCFSQAKEVFFTRAEKISGSSTTPSRWLLRIETLAKKLNINLIEKSHNSSLTIIENNLKNENDIAMVPVELRPKQLSVTQIEKLVFNPYYIYVDSILSLKKLLPIERKISALDFGLFIHKALELYNANSEKSLERLLNSGRQALSLLNLAQQQLQIVFWSRFVRIAQWFIANENQKNKIYLEIKGRAKIGDNFILIARADRLEIATNNAVDVIDYKTGNLSTYKSIQTGRTLQLLLEGIIAARGGFDCQKKLGNVENLKYIKLSGSEDPVEILEIDLTNDDLLVRAEKYLNDLIKEYEDPATAYHYTKAKKIGYCEYSHLARKFY